MMFAALGIFAGLSLNLFLQFALGVSSKKDESGNDTQTTGTSVPHIQTGCLFLAIILFWVIYYFILRAVSIGFLEYFLMFPLSCLICFGVETGIKKILPEKMNKKFDGSRSHGALSALTGYDGLALASFILTSRLAVHFLDGIVLAFSFALGCLFVSAIIAEISRRALLEKVPAFIRGTPLLLISMGLLSMVFAAVAGICFSLFEFF